MEAEFINPPGLCPTFGWTHVVAHAAGRLIHLSGQVAVNERGEVVGRGDLKRQAEQAFENLRQGLAASGATWNDVIVTRLYVVGLKPEHVPIIREVRGRYISATHAPASTLVGVSALVGADWLIEVEATAYLP